MRCSPSASAAVGCTRPPGARTTSSDRASAQYTLSALMLTPCTFPRCTADPVNRVCAAQVRTAQVAGSPVGRRPPVGGHHAGRRDGRLTDAAGG